MTPGCIYGENFMLFASKMVLFASITKYKMEQNNSALRGLFTTHQRSITVLWWCYMKRERRYRTYWIPAYVEHLNENCVPKQLQADCQAEVKPP